MRSEAGGWTTTTAGVARAVACRRAGGEGSGVAALHARSCSCWSTELRIMRIAEEPVVLTDGARTNVAVLLRMSATVEEAGGGRDVRAVSPL